MLLPPKPAIWHDPVPVPSTSNPYPLSFHKNSKQKPNKCCKLVLWSNQPTNQQMPCPSWEANSHSANQEILHLSWNLKVHIRVHKSPPLVSVSSRMNPVRTFPLYFLNIYSNIIFLVTPMSSEWSLPFRFSTKLLHEFIISSMRVTFLVFLILLNLITQIIFGGRSQ